MSENLMPFDELNVLCQKLKTSSRKKTKEDKKKDVDDILDMLVMAYVLGNDSVNEELGTDVEPDMYEIKSTVFQSIKGKTCADRLNEYSELDQIDNMIRVAETEMTRCYNEGALWTAKESGVPAMKTWQTVMDDKVRDTHEYLENVSVPLEAMFYTFDGDSAMYPGGFSLPENNVNCRCAISIEAL